MHKSREFFSPLFSPLPSSMSDRNSSKSSSKSSSKPSQPKPAKKPNTSAANPKARKTKPVAKRARTDTSATPVAESVTDFVVIDDDGDGNEVDSSDEDIELEKDPEAILGTLSLPFFFRHLPLFSCSSEDLAIRYLPLL
jgi:hypothetical protein